MPPSPLQPLASTAAADDGAVTPAARRAARDRLRSILFGTIEELAQNSEDRARVAAALGGLRALAQLDAIDQRQRRLEQHDRMIALHEQHLALMRARDERASVLHKHTARKLDAEVKQSEAAAANESEQLNRAELQALEELLPHVEPFRFRIPSLAARWREHIVYQRFWDAYWKGDEDARRPHPQYAVTRGHHLKDAPGVPPPHLEAPPGPPIPEIPEGYIIPDSEVAQNAAPSGDPSPPDPPPDLISRISPISPIVPTPPPAPDPHPP